MLDPEVRAHVEASPPDQPLGVDDAAARRLAARRWIDGIFERFGLPGPPVARVVDHDVPVSNGSILVRSYHPHETPHLPAHVYLHGGGWTGGSVHELVCDATARHRSVASGCVTFAVEYRLAPEHRFPTAVHDVVAVIRWIREHTCELGVDPRTITMGGSSAGAKAANQAWSRWK